MNGLELPGSRRWRRRDAAPRRRRRGHQRVYASREGTEAVSRHRDGVDAAARESTRLVRRYQSTQAEKRAQQEEERKAKRKAKERDALQRSRAPRKKRVSVDAPVQRRGKQKYPIDDSLLSEEPPVSLAERPSTIDPCVELLRGLPPDKVGDVLAIHALLKAVAARRTAKGLKRGRPSTGLDLEESPNQPPPLHAFAAALASPLKTLPGPRGALEPLRLSLIHI